jgi:hypothetical protein
MLSETCNRVRVERYFLEEVGAEEKRETGAHLEACGRCKGHLDFLSRERQGYLSVRPFSGFAAKHLDKVARAPRFGFGPRWLPALAGAMACLALVIVLRNPGGGLQGGSADGLASAETRYKGGEVLEFHLSRDGKVEPGNPAAEHRAGDRLQFVFSADKAAYATLLSVDAAGKVSVYRAEGAAAAVPVEPGKLAPFPFSVTLDEARGGELFVAVFSAAPLEDASLEAWLAEAFKSSGDLAQAGAAHTPPSAAASLKTLLLKKAAT